MDFIETQAAKTITGMVRGIDELKSRGSDLPVYRAALTLPLTQGGITAVLGAIAERPSGWAATLQNTGGAGETFLVVAVDGVWRTWQQGIPFITLPLPVADGGTGASTAPAALTNLGGGATGVALFGATTQAAARTTLGLDMITMPARQLDHSGLTYTATNVLGGATWVSGLGLFRQGITSATPNSRSQVRPATDVGLLNHGANFASWNRRLEVGGYFLTALPNAEGVFRIMYGKPQLDGYGALSSGRYIGWQISNSTITALYACKESVLTTIAVSVAIPTFLGAHIWVISEGNGTVTWYVNGVSIGATANGPTVANAGGSITAEINNGATAADYSVTYASMSKGY